VREIVSEPGKVVLQDFPDCAWFWFRDEKDEKTIQRSFVVAGQRINLIDSSCGGSLTREGIDASPFPGYTLEFIDSELYAKAMSNSLGQINGAAVAQAEGPDSASREIWLGCEHLGKVPWDYEGSFHWGLVVGDPKTSRAFEVTGQGQPNIPMCVVGPKGLVACSPKLTGKHLEDCKRPGRTLREYGPSFCGDGTFVGGYILLPYKTKLTDEEIERFTTTWVKENPVYGGNCQCQTYCHALYQHLTGFQFPYRDIKLKTETLFVSASELPHYQSSFQWTCRRTAEA